ncbi:MAG: DUF1269 domain-containing protein [Syntrophobacteraceae bacterium]|jgi:uncharacterized membrane protein
MGLFAEYAAKAMGLKLPAEYLRFMEKYGKKLVSDPINQESWVSGLGDVDFVVGTTLAFRASIPNFSVENVVIGYLGIKTIVINRTYEEIDTYVMLNTRDGKILSVDSRGVEETIADGFDAWVGSELLRAELKEKYESTLTVVMFDEELKAEKARANLMKLQRRGHIDIEDMVVVVKDQDGTARYHQMHKPARKGGLAGSITGLIVGSIFFSPLIGAVLGAITGAVSASLADMGIDDQFTKDLSQKFKPGCSALFALVRKADPERVGEAFLGFGGKVLVNSISAEREAAIQALLDETGGRAG